MADIAQDAQLSRDDALLPAASKLFSHLWDEAWTHAPQTVAGDADALHDMRVALRRLRSALENFEGDETPLPLHLRQEFHAWRRKLGKLGDALGAVRDHDVLDDYLRDYAKSKLKSPVSASPGLSAFERYLQTERAQSFGPMVKRINKSAAPRKSRERFARWSLGVPGALPPGSNGTKLGAAARAVLHGRIDDALALGPTLDDPANDEGHHDLRKALRRIRYTLETMSVAFREPVKPHVKTLTDIQDVLGELQDRAVLREVAERAFKGQEAQPDIAAFLAHGEARRRYTLGRARTAWKQLQTSNFFETLRAL